MNTFKPGEIAIITDKVHPSYSHYVGTECTVIESLDWNIEVQYVVAACDGRRYLACHYHLRKKRPPEQREPVTTWDQVPYFNPTRVPA